ncbi:hypothetical protein [Pedobacter duraquae]|uniref:SPFH domain/Band 7 family protein n=1 Tax=Pedobacter duraquae TaxID=425511 RepID=A0A4R6IIV4_9SPHI|nr:hypothetical protein [Pedobacter duraquae]TDO21901.1 hypothetical protein CLV32_3009 [Pedobacter duraquae]
MKSRKLIIGLLAIALTVSITSCERVAPNYIGVLMENYGKAGKEDFSTTKGKVNTMTPGTELFQVPLFEQRAKFEAPLSLKAADNTAFTSKPTYSYAVIEQRAVDVVFQNKQLGSGDEFMKALEDNILEAKIYDIMKEESRKFITDSLMANGGSLRFEERVQGLVSKEFEERGLKLTTFSSQLEFSDKVTKKIDNRNEVNTNVSVLDQQIIEQRKRNQLALLKAEENKILSSGITPELLSQQAIDKWNGQLPSTWAGSSLPFVKSLK